MKKWQMEYYYGGVCCRFTIQAETFEDAVRQGDQIMRSMRRTATYSI